MTGVVLVLLLVVVAGLVAVFGADSRPRIDDPPERWLGSRG